MKKLLLLLTIFYFPVTIAQAQLLGDQQIDSNISSSLALNVGRLPDKNASDFELVKYIEQLLTKVFPGDAPYMTNVTISIMSQAEPEAYNLHDNLVMELHISRGLVALFQNESEFAFIIAHEYFHFKKNHKGTATIRFGDISENFELREKQELEADQLATQSITDKGFDSCAQLTLYQRIPGYDSVSDDSNNPYDTIIRKRMAAARSRCKSK